MGSRVVKTVVIEIGAGIGVKAMFGARRGSHEQGHGRGWLGALAWARNPAGCCALSEP